MKRNKGARAIFKGKTVYLRIPPLIVKELKVSDGDIFKVKYKSETISYARDRTQSKPNTIVG